MIVFHNRATLPGFSSKGLSIEEGESLLERSVKLAVEACDSFWNSVKRNPGNRYRRALVAASIGSYGAYLADGSEYSGCYGPDVNLKKLKDFYHGRLQVLVEAQNVNGSTQNEERTAPKRSQQEQLLHWQMNRRTLAYSTVGTPDYIAPEVLLKKGYYSTVGTPDYIAPEVLLKKGYAMLCD
uniref:Homocysteine S-methyltransferase 1 n=1 Tax=Cajanus cajan TaxID=3821 RepID=A0A151RGD1_CAJCA|nr:Homocysteine S-methyltransferase 1 [Cajanus cajan]